jgi:serine O-acetyltransferase
MVNRVLFGVETAPQTRIGPGLYFPHTNGIVIGAAQIGARCVIYHQVTLGAKTIDMKFTPTERPIVGDDVTIAAGAKVLGGVQIGDGAVIAANAVVVEDVDGGALVGGVPAVVLRPAAP